MLQEVRSQLNCCQQGMLLTKVFWLGSFSMKFTVAKRLLAKHAICEALGFSCPLALYIDAKSVFAAVSATFIKLPAEKSLLCHVQFVRELLERRVLEYMAWIDTRDMTSDGLPKGAVSRELLHQVMDTCS